MLAFYMGETVISPVPTVYNAYWLQDPNIGESRVSISIQDIVKHIFSSFSVVNMLFMNLL